MRARTKLRTNRLVRSSSNWSTGSQGYPIVVDGLIFYPPYEDLFWYKHARVKWLPYSDTQLQCSDTMLDEVQHRTWNPRARLWNPCEHTRISYENAVYSRMYASSNSPPTTYLDIGMWTPPPSVSPSLCPAFPSEGSRTLQRWRAGAYAQLVPQLKNGGFSGLNSLYELKDLKGLVHVCSRGIPAMASAIKKMGRKATRSMKGSAQTAADLTLSYDYGLKPMIKDVADAINLFEKLRDMLNVANAKGAIRSVHHYTGSPVETMSSSANTSYVTWTETELSYRAQVELTYSFSIPMDANTVIDLMGLSINPERVWNAIPFSFVVDWFVSIGDFLGSMDLGIRAVPRVSQFSETVSSRYVKALYPYVPMTVNPILTQCVCPTPPTGRSHHNGQPVVAWSEAKIYKRKPNSFSVLTQGPFSHVRLPELHSPFPDRGAMQRIRDGVAMVTQLLL